MGNHPGLPGLPSPLARSWMNSTPNHYGLESNHPGLESAKPDLQSVFRKPGGGNAEP